MQTKNELCIAAAIITRADGKILLVRKRGSSIFIQPGGKMEAQETPILALCRELREELELTVEPAEPIYLGRYSAPAANEPGCIVTAELFQLELSRPVIAAAELEELLWIDPDRLGDVHIAPLTRDHVLTRHTRSSNESMRL